MFLSSAIFERAFERPCAEIWLYIYFLISWCSAIFPAKMPRAKTVNEQIRELQQKITLIEGDRSAYAQASQYKIEKNNQKIADLRKENKELHQR